ncbi:MAG: molybdenum cofactor guanylyltransferase MobA [Woeseiaceae bacterium]
MIQSTQNISAIILAGGQGSRLNGADKGFVLLAQQPLIQHVIQRIEPQVSEVLISANRNIERYKELNFDVLEDATKDFSGPLAGILQALLVCKNEWLLVVPADSPFIARDMATRLMENNQQVKIVIPDSGEHLQPTFSLIHKSLAPSLEHFLQQGERKARVWMQQQAHKIVGFSDSTDAFININTEEDLKNAEQHLQKTMR